MELAAIGIAGASGQRRVHGFFAYGGEKRKRGEKAKRRIGEGGKGQDMSVNMRYRLGELRMHNEFTAIIEQDEGWFIAYCPEVPGANGQGRTKEECLKSLSEAIALILEDRREDALRGAPDDAERIIVNVG